MHAALFLPRKSNLNATLADTDQRPGQHRLPLGLAAINSQTRAGGRSNMDRVRRDVDDVMTTPRHHECRTHAG